MFIMGPDGLSHCFLYDIFYMSRDSGDDAAPTGSSTRGRGSASNTHKTAMVERVRAPKVRQQSVRYNQDSLGSLVLVFDDV